MFAKMILPLLAVVLFSGSVKASNDAKIRLEKGKITAKNVDEHSLRDLVLDSMDDNDELSSNLSKRCYEGSQEDVYDLISKLAEQKPKMNVEYKENANSIFLKLNYRKHDSMSEFHVLIEECK